MFYKKKLSLKQDGIFTVLFFFLQILMLCQL